MSIISIILHKENLVINIVATISTFLLKISIINVKYPALIFDLNFELKDIN